MSVIYNYPVIPGAALAVSAAGAFCGLQRREMGWGQGLCAVGKEAGRAGKGQASGRDCAAVGVLGRGLLIRLSSAHPVLFSAITHQDELGGKP